MMPAATAADCIKQKKKNSACSKTHILLKACVLVTKVKFQVQVSLFKAETQEVLINAVFMKEITVVWSKRATKACHSNMLFFICTTQLPPAHEIWVQENIL